MGGCRPTGSWNQHTGSLGLRIDPCRHVALNIVSEHAERETLQQAAVASLGPSRVANNVVRNAEHPCKTRGLGAQRRAQPPSLKKHQRGAVLRRFPLAGASQTEPEHGIRQLGVERLESNRVASTHAGPQFAPVDLSLGHIS
ncbi:hypothetical protein GCM10011376_38010 [Nocardioides flavus (ex Wang et al. 2016)]|uniref:Uncharacterized protein n=1 Tax=Nocardioides flavus (ex Wang et al. 2016) TaxID=2058780 RepID=A0ABQ3HPH5_9ACTN|nr:hypothetical protein GCM10011376_38010 [Nocardioides flavus (ex Wang et al. 2016)]